MTLPKEYTTNTVISKDGTTIGYRQMGTGPGLVLVHGGMMYSDNYMQLGTALSDAFTIYIPDRRGRGLSGPHGYYSLMAEAEDLQAIVAQTGAQNIFGLSSGALCTLQAAIIEPAIRKVALYEAPIPVYEAGHPSLAWIAKYEAAMAQQNFGKAFTRIVKGTGDTFFNYIPDFIIVPLMNMLINASEKKRKDGDVSFKTLISAIHYDTIALQQSAGLIDAAKNIQAALLLLNGKKSQEYLKAPLAALAAAIPTAKRIELAGIGHMAPDNSGKPEIVAKELRSFFAG